MLDKQTKLTINEINTNELTLTIREPSDLAE